MLTYWEPAITKILLGVHGNGLTHQLFMPPSLRSAVIEIQPPGGELESLEPRLFARSYHLPRLRFRLLDAGPQYGSQALHGAQRLSNNICSQRVA